MVDRRLVVLRTVAPASLLVAGAGAVPREARAQAHAVCLYLDLGAELWDASPRAADGEDFDEEHGRNDGPTAYPAQRWLARVRDEATGTVLFGWAPLDSSGCATIELEADTTLAFEWTRWAVWSDTGNQQVGYFCDPWMASCELDVNERSVPASLATGGTEIILTAFDYEEVDVALWVTSFAEERFSAMGDQPLDDTRIYVGYDEQDILPGATQADRTFGNQPSVVIAGDAVHSKFAVAHELGHHQTIGAEQSSFGPDDLDYCHDPAVYPAVPHGCSSNHTMESHEWQAAALIEGIAHWYAVVTWHDVDLVECQNCQPGVRYVAPSAPDDARSYIVPRQEPLCAAPGNPCPPGVGNEWDWLSAFRRFRLEAAPSFRTMLEMASAAFTTGNWPLHSPDGAFWLAFDQAMAAYLGPHHAAWLVAADAMELDR